MSPWQPSRSHRDVARTLVVAPVLVSALSLLVATHTLAATCGDGTIEYPEQCDDGNLVSGDGCSAGCLDECPSLAGDWLAVSDAPGSLDTTWTIAEDAAGNLEISAPGDTLTGTRTPGVRSPVLLTSAGTSFTLSGEMTSCDAIDLQIDLLPWTVTLTRIVEPPPCQDALPLANAKVTLSGLASAPGEQNLLASGRIVLPSGFFFEPALAGMQILLEDLGNGGTAVFDVTHATRPIPSYASETCFGRGEGWRRRTYRSVMKPLDPEECRLGTADVLTLRLVDRRPRFSEAAFSLRVRHASIAPPVGPLRLTLAVGGTAEALEAARCGDPQPVLACTPSSNGKRLRCL